MNSANSRVFLPMLPQTSLLMLLSVTLAQPLPAAELTPQEVLKHEVGTWDAHTKTWISPDSKPLVSEGVETNKMLGEYWVVGVFESDIVGMKFRGQSQVGYNPTKKKFIGTWIDSMSPTLNRLEGTMQDGKLVMLAEGVDLATGKPKTTKMVTTYPDKDHKTFESYDPVPGKKGEWWKTMEVTYTRRK